MPWYMGSGVLCVYADSAAGVQRPRAKVAKHGHTLCVCVYVEGPPVPRMAATTSAALRVWRSGLTA